MALLSPHYTVKFPSAAYSLMSASESAVLGCSANRLMQLQSQSWTPSSLIQLSEQFRASTSDLVSVRWPSSTRARNPEQNKEFQMAHMTSHDQIPDSALASVLRGLRLVDGRSIVVVFFSYLLLFCCSRQSCARVSLVQKLLLPDSISACG